MPIPPERPVRWADLYNLATAVTILRLIIAVTAPFLLRAGVALPFYLFALFTDVLDGALARRRGTVTRAGAMLDGWVDKILHVNLGWSMALADMVPDWWALCWYAREILQALMIPILVHRFRLGFGPAPETSLSGRLAAVSLAVAFVMTLTGFDASIPTYLTGFWGVLSAIGYARRHLR